MATPQVYLGINRETSPDWLGWVILDLLDADHTESKLNREEIKVQLNYEVKMFHQQNKISNETNQMAGLNH